jgi:alpha-L-rhamnosidase
MPHLHKGRVGFFTPKESWPLFEYVKVTNSNGRTLLFDDFTDDLSKWDFSRTLSFVADGAKRDRLVWSGDLYFAQRNAYYAFADPSYMRESLLMLAFNQTPEGFVHAAPYPEIDTPPLSGNYGHFESDEFAAWMIPVVWEHLLFTDDKDTIEKIWPAITRLIDYLQTHTNQNTGLFIQRPETSKQAGSLRLGNVRTRSYMNILLWGAYRDAAKNCKLPGPKERGESLQRICP